MFLCRSHLPLNLRSMHAGVLKQRPLDPRGCTPRGTSKTSQGLCRHLLFKGNQFQILRWSVLSVLKLPCLRKCLWPWWSSGSAFTPPLPELHSLKGRYTSLLSLITTVLNRGIIKILVWTAEKLNDSNDWLNNRFTNKFPILFFKSNWKKT